MQVTKMPKWIKLILKIFGIFLLFIVSLLAIYVIVEYNTLDEMVYTVNADGKTCTVTGAKDPDTLFLRIPKEIDGYTVTEIAPETFIEYTMWGVIIPDTISKIGKSAFEYCRQLRWVIGIENCSSLKEIDEFTFCHCESLQSINLPKSIETIDKCAFTSCFLLSDISLPQNLKVIGFGAFGACNQLNQMYVPASVKSIGERAFSGILSLKSITVDELSNYWSSPDGVLYHKDMKVLHSYPNGKTDKTYSIPDGVTTVFNYAFAFNTNIEILEIPSSITYLGEGVIADVKSKSSKLHTINYNGTVAMWRDIKKSPNWAKDAPDFTIYCTDGQISKNGIATYN